MSKAQIYVYGIIGQETSLIDVIRQLKSFDNPDSVEVIIDSVGGGVDEGMAIFNYLRNLGLPITTFAVKAYSIASVVFFAGDIRQVEEGEGRLMIHFPWCSIDGGADRLESVAKELRTIENDFIDFYSKYTNIDKGSIAKLLHNETFLSSAEAFELGFATDIVIPIMAVALFSNDMFEDVSLNNNNKQEEMNKIEKLITSALNSFTNTEDEVETVALVIMDANGVEINFPDVSEVDEPVVGDKALVDGSPAEGEYVSPEGNTMVFESGELKEIKEEEVIEEVVEEVVDEVVEEEIKEEDFMQLFKELFAKAKTEVQEEMEVKFLAINKINEDLNSEVVALKKLIGSEDLESEKNEKISSNLSKGMQRASEILSSRKR